MKFTIAQEELARVLGLVSGLVPSRTTLPVLGNVLIETTPQGIQVSATDLDLSVTVPGKAAVGEAGAVTLPARRLAEMVRALPVAPVNVTAQGDKVQISCRDSMVRLFGLPKADFPSLPQVAFAGALQTSPSLLGRLISRTAFAASTEDTRPILNGVLWEIEAEETSMVATNGHRLAKCTLRLDHPAEARAPVIVPPRALGHALRLFEAAQTIEVAFAENMLGFRDGGAVLFTRLIEGPYPNYEQVIPRDNDKVAVVSTEALTGALRRMAVIASDQTHRVKLAFARERLALNVSTPDVGEAAEELPVDYAGEALEIGFNATYLLDVLKVIEHDTVRIAFKSPERAAVIESAEQREGESYLCLVMPLRLQE